MRVIEGRPSQSYRSYRAASSRLLGKLEHRFTNFLSNRQEFNSFHRLWIIADYLFGRSDEKTISCIQVTVSWLVQSFNAIFNVFRSNTKIYKMKLQIEVLFFLLALEFQCLKGDVVILQKYKNQRVYSPQELHIKVYVLWTDDHVLNFCCSSLIWSFRLWKGSLIDAWFIMNHYSAWDICSITIIGFLVTLRDRERVLHRWWWQMLETFHVALTSLWSDKWL